MFGLLNICKAQGATSRDVVNVVQRIVRPHKVGHAGTLDPLATGVLVVCVGPATRLVPYVQQMRKTYRGTFLLGQRSETEDIDGTVEVLEGAPIVDAAQIQATLAGFRGRIMQRPPTFSALKVNGKRAHELARAGKPPKLAARPVVIHELELVEFAYPQMTLKIVCSSGTYVRSLGRDIAQQVGSAAVMSALQRTRIGPFTIEEAIDARQLTGQMINTALLPASHAVAELPFVALAAKELEAIRHGREIDDRFGLADEQLAVVDEDGHLAAILRRASAGRLRPFRNFTDVAS